jgi:hypothetical protein
VSATDADDAAFANYYHGYLKAGMAPWQVEFIIVPRRAFAGTGTISRAAFAGTNWWAAYDLPSDYQRQLTNVAAAAAAASGDATPQLQTCGPEDGNRIDVWFEHGRVSRVMARVDVRRLDSRFGASLLQFVRVADALLVRSDGLVIEPIISAYAAALRGSEAWRYANDPAAFLARQADDESDEA